MTASQRRCDPPVGEGAQVLPLLELPVFGITGREAGPVERG